ncbi:MAG: hypothetical protein P8Y25_08495, partial [Chromatiaceae bacterium]
TEKAPNPIEVADPDSRSAVFQSDSMPGPGIADHRLAVSRPNFQLSAGGRDWDIGDIDADQTPHRIQ